MTRRLLRTRLALLYGGVFFAAGAVLLGFVFGALWSGGYTESAPASSPGVITLDYHHHGLDPHTLVIALVVGLVAMALLAAGLGWLIAERSLHPLHRMTTTAQAISADSLHSRIGLDSPYAEFAELGSTLDNLFARLDDAFRSQRDFVANAAHELRTPLTAQRALLQVALADPAITVDSLRAACVEVLALGSAQERLIGSLLTLASTERGTGHWQHLDLADVAAEVTLARRDDAARHGVQITTALEPAPAQGDPGLIESLVANLVDNAIRHNTPGGTVDVVTSGTSLTVRNTGALIPPAEVGRLFEPFQRLRRGRSSQDDGHGLGLAIVRAIATSHAATITARTLDSGGLDVTVRFPHRDETGPDAARSAAAAGGSLPAWQASEA